jgi:sugar phosphate isomerase/epimerase
VTVDLALTPDARWGFSTADLVSAATSAGFSSLGINVERVDADAARDYAASALGCHELLALVVSDDEWAVRSDADRLAAAAETMGAAWVLTVFTTPLAPSTASLIAQCANVFAEAGTSMAVEFSPLGPVSSISSAMAAVRAAGRGDGRAGLLIDSWHFCLGESSWDDLATVPLEDIAYVQFDDAPKPDLSRMLRETLHCRALPGEGTLELDRFAHTLLDRGWEGVVSMEVLNARLRDLPVDVVTRRIFDASAPFWR